MKSCNFKPVGIDKLSLIGFNEDMKKLHILFILAVLVISGFVVFAYIEQKNRSETPQIISQRGIKVTYPAPNEVVQSPLRVRGEATGRWYFEADFPVMLLDENRNVLARSPATAQGDWMTEDFVPFEAVLEFEKPQNSTRGILVLEKNNPSDLRENDERVEIPVKF